MNTKDHAQVKTIPPLIPLFFIVASWLVDQYVFSLKIPIKINTQMIIAYFFLASSLLLFSYSLYFFIKTKQNPEPHTPTNSLYTGGIFRITRNPIYLGFLTAQIVVAIKFNNLYTVLTLPFVILLINKWVIEPEEVYLEKQFGEKYVSYKNKVRRWI